MRFTVLLALLSVPAAAQWKIEKNVDLRAVAPRVQYGPDKGKPDFSGVWQQSGMTQFRDLMSGIPAEERPYTPESRAIVAARADGAQGTAEPDANCLPQGVPKINATPVPFRIVQTPELIVLVYEAFNLWRMVHMDGRATVKDPNPAWLGYSVGRWDKDTLVVESHGFNGRSWLDTAGHPASEKLRVTERFTRTNMGTLELEITIDDPVMYTRPWKAKEQLTLQPNTELLEFICPENEKDLIHMNK